MESRTIRHALVLLRKISPKNCLYFSFHQVSVTLIQFFLKRDYWPSGLERLLLRSDHGRGPGFESRQGMADNMYSVLLGTYIAEDHGRALVP